MIRIVNLRNYELSKNEVLIKVDRSSVLGNPFYMSSEVKRDEVCDKYKEYFDSIVDNGIMAQLNLSKEERIEFINELRRIYKVAKEKDIALGCWCYPKRCHAETIKRFIEQYIK